MRRLALGAALAALVLPLAACGGSAAPTLSSVAQAATKTEAAGTARFAVQFDAKGLPGQAGAAGFTAEGEVDYDKQRTRMTMDLGSLGSLLGPAAQGKDLSFDVLVDGASTVYLRFPLLSQLVGEGKPWLKLDAESLAQAAGKDLGELGQLNQGDPSQALAYLKAAGDFAEAGTETVRGVETTHYTGAIDLSKAVEEVPEGQRAQLERLLDEGAVKELPAEAWIDDNGYLRKLTLAFAGLAGASDAGFDLTMEMFDFGSPVDIEPPPADEVTDITDLATKGGLGS